LQLQQVRHLLKNVTRLDNQQVVDWCAAEIARRSPKKPNTTRQRKPDAEKGDEVTGFHFVCEDDAGVTINPDGTFWTGSWVVDVRHARDSKLPGTNAA
jgi:hypothetical protein